MRLHLSLVTTLVTALAVAMAGPPARAEDPPVFRIVLKDHRFEPAEIAVPAGQRLVLVVQNADSTPAEFESRELNVEKVISGDREATIRVGPLAPGRYPFVDEFHQDQAHGALVAKE